MTPTTQIEVSGRRQSVVVEAIIDTGFDGELSLPKEIAITLGLKLIGFDEFELADGSEIRELQFKGRARLAGKTRTVRILVSDSQDTLIGTQLLKDCQLTVDFSTNKVRIVRK